MIVSSERVAQAFTRLREKDEPVGAGELGMRPPLWTELVEAGLVRVERNVVTLTDLGRVSTVVADRAPARLRAAEVREHMIRDQAEIRDRLIHGGPRG